MAETKDQEFFQMSSGKADLGTIQIAPEVITVIAGIAAHEVDGVAATRGNFAAGVVELLGKKVHGKGIKTDISSKGLFIDVFCTIRYGKSVPTIAQEVQQSVRQAILNMTGLEVKEVNVHVTGIQFDTPENNQ
ncbi:Asp23/Gls24 family envelope stress response protein [Chryseomicrobium excrementi]|uniref:Asp23/Gls24 family envelope stress response protein n=1 Tax=Chryseomicrobium excrementi TaxID=2041346 RepID=A0A2M9F2H2_9BACL|nr:Asp23/Gls24 family envelope stress response protein [Chryseomicrobium excrementi]PJK17605.1 Asp23/Gls24 family envelope stress response protein [Chryseomicrobium excrementi]